MKANSIAFEAKGKLMTSENTASKQKSCSFVGGFPVWKKIFCWFSISQCLRYKHSLAFWGLKNTPKTWVFKWGIQIHSLRLKHIHLKKGIFISILWESENTLEFMNMERKIWLYFELEIEKKNKIEYKKSLYSKKNRLSPICFEVRSKERKSELCLFTAFLFIE